MAARRRKVMDIDRSSSVPRTYRLAPEKVAAAQRALGSATATEAIETALDLAPFRRELIGGTLPFDDAGGEIRAFTAGSNASGSRPLACFEQPFQPDVPRDTETFQHRRRARRASP
jgi:hypothetical protein